MCLYRHLVKWGDLVKFVIASIVMIILLVVVLLLLKKTQLRLHIKIILLACVAVLSFSGTLLMFTFTNGNNLFMNKNEVYSSPQEALEAYTNTEKINTVVEVEGGAFLICNTYNPLFGISESSEVVHTVLCRDEGKWSAVDLYNIFDEGGIIRISEQTNVYGSGVLTYNSELDKSLIKLRLFISGTDDDKESFDIKDKDGNIFTTYDLSSNSATDISNYSCYLVIDGKMKNGFEVFINGIEASLYCAI